MAKRVEFHLIRHGATRNNAESGTTDRIRGWMDLPLSDIGRKEVARLAGRLEDSGLEYIAASDMLRARETAGAIASSTGAKVEHLRGLRPWDLGKFTGEESRVVGDQILSYAKNKSDQSVPQGESFDTFLHRCLGTIAGVIDKHKGETFAIVSHHRVERLLKAWIGAGEQPAWEVNWAIFNKHGEKTGSCEVLDVDPDALQKAVRVENKKREKVT